MAQGIGYCIAAVVPVVIGYTYEVTNSWLTATYLIAALILAQSIIGIKANK
jgi:cyanate permease